MQETSDAVFMFMFLFAMCKIIRVTYCLMFSEWVLFRMCSETPPNTHTSFFPPSPSSSLSLSLAITIPQFQGTSIAVSSEPPTTGHRDEAVALRERST